MKPLFAAIGISFLLAQLIQYISLSDTLPTFGAWSGDCIDTDNDGICDNVDPCPFLAELLNGDECNVGENYGNVVNCSCIIDGNNQTIVQICNDPDACNYFTGAGNPEVTYLVDPSICLEPHPDCTACSETNVQGNGTLILLDADGDGICDASEQEGCTTATACNYNILATENDGSCIIPVVNCFQCLPMGGVLFFDSDGDGTCNALEVHGCTLSSACNYNLEATEDDGSCLEPIPNCFECDGSGQGIFIDSDGDGICNAFEILGCTNFGACNYNSIATDNDGTCVWPEPNCTSCVFGAIVLIDSDGDGVCNSQEILGCTLAQACNFNALATENNGECILPIESCTICGPNGDLLIIDSDFDGICDAAEIAGCTNPAACNYLPAATDDSGFCNIPVPNCTFCFGNFPFLITIDTDQDGICNLYDPDDDNDGCPDLIDDFPFQPGPDSDCDPTTIECPTCPPANNLCAGAISLACGAVVTGSTVNATPTGAPAPCFDETSTAAGGVWYLFEGNGDIVTISTCGSQNDTRLDVYSGSCASLICITVNDYSPDCGDDELLSSVTFATSLGTSYYVYVNGFGVNQGNFTLNVTCEPPVVEASIAGTVAWSSSCGTRNGILTLYQPNTNTLVASAAIVVAADGTFTAPMLTPGIYDVIVKVDGYLAKGAQDVVLAAGSNALAAGNLTTGDLDGNNVYDISDITLLLGVFNLSSSSPAFNPLADINCSGVIDINDLTLLLAVTFNQSGAVAPL